MMDNRRSHIWPVMFVASLSLIVTLTALAAGRFDVFTGIRPVVLVDHSLNHAPAGTIKDLQLTGPWRLAEEGLILSGGESGMIALPVMIGREGRISLFLQGQSGPGFRHSIDISEDGRRYRQVLQDVSLDGLRIDLTRPVGHLSSFWLRVSVASGTGTPCSVCPS